jgi:hypothetical protein
MVVWGWGFYLVIMLVMKYFDHFREFLFLNSMLQIVCKEMNESIFHLHLQKVMRDISVNY